MLNYFSSPLYISEKGKALGSGSETTRPIKWNDIAKFSAKRMR